MQKIIVILPTYNERENINSLIKGILNLKIQNLHILVVDDNSPDNTSAIVKNLKHPNVRLLLRKGKRGRGLAGVAGFKKALELKADCIIEMDADFSHDPKYIPVMLNEIRNFDLILGSRLVENSKDLRDSVVRKIITKYANAYTRLLLNINIKDCNSGYRCFRRKVLENIVKKLKAPGPDIVQEVLYIAWIKNYRIKEIPIEFHARKKGTSKLGLKQILRGFWIIIKLRIKHLVGII